jgi:hypothetical protein
MDLPIAIVLCLLFLALIVLGEIYLGMDKQRAPNPPSEAGLSL